MRSKFDPQKHPFDLAQGRHRRSIRLPNYDYSQTGAYFVTIVVWHREFLFGEIENGEIRLNKVGEIVQWEWKALPKRLHYIELGAHVVMPNHFHGILIFHETVGASRPGLTNTRSGAMSLPVVTVDGIGLMARPYLMESNPPL
jgi:REP element-mobilizing transposase RayT